MADQEFERGRIENSGCGGFLNPPTHPEHNLSCTGKDFIMSLSSAADAEWLHPKVRAKCREKLAAWHRPPIDDKRIQDWIRQVLGYFENCYLPKSGSKNTSDLIIDRERDPLEYADTHRGADFIREWYPEFTLTAQHLDEAYWGQKPKA